MNEFQQEILNGIPTSLPEHPGYDSTVSHAPRRKDVLNTEEKQLALRNALRYFDVKKHSKLANEFALELKTYGRIYMYRYRPTYKMCARPLDDYPANCNQAAAIMLMIQNNLDPAVAQHPHELITYGGNGAVFQNWAQYRLTMSYLAEMNSEQTLHIHSGHPQGLFPSSIEAPRVVVTNGMMIPNHSKPNDLEKYNALGVTQYGQMTAGSYMYIGPQGIVHGTTITLMNAARKFTKGNLEGKIFITAGLGGMSGAQPKAASIAGMVSITAEINKSAAIKRQSQGWVDEIHFDVNTAIFSALESQEEKGNRSIAFVGNIVDLWEALIEHNVTVDLGSDQTSLHNPWAGGYYPQGYSYEEANELMVTDPVKFKSEVEQTLRKHIAAINRLHAKGMYFFDYGNAFLLESSRAGADVLAENGIDFSYPSYVQDILGPLCFDYGFGPFRWVCSSGSKNDLKLTDDIAANILRKMSEKAPKDIMIQMKDNLHWIENANDNNLVVGSQARILYADSIGRIAIAEAFNKAVAKGEVGPIIIGRDHHDVSGTDSPYRETSNIYDGSKFTADMAVHNAIGDSFRGATWVSLHNGGGVGWGEVINGGFGMLLDGSAEAERKLKSMLFYDVNNGIARRAWARNPEALIAMKREMLRESSLKVTIPEIAEDDLINSTIDQHF
ncbi:MAG: Urocanate hydratase [Owenweeksia sp. TMED14]|nr:MAG: Urocanate hydratase [Owenweeksia sp. TMED14]